MVKINIEKRTLFLWGIVLVILVGLVGVYAYGGSSPSTMGHTMGEIQDWHVEGSYGIYYDKQLGIGGGTGPIGLDLRVHGNVGAEQYCDEDGEDCKTITELSSGGSSGGTGYYSLSGLDFLSRDELGLYDDYSLEAGCLKSLKASMPAYAEVHLPHGAIVTEVFVYNQGRSWNLVRRTLANYPTSTSTMASGTTSPDTTISYATINNSQYSYYLHASLSQVGNRLCGGYVKFTYP